MAAAVFVPTLAPWANAVPNLAPVNLSLPVGAGLFGIGMQLGGGCGSGIVVGSGVRSTHTVMVMVFLIPGSLFGSIHLSWWLAIGPTITVDLGSIFGVPGVVALQTAFFIAIAWAARQYAGQNYQPILLAGQTLMGIVVILAMLALSISG